MIFPTIMFWVWMAAQQPKTHIEGVTCWPIQPDCAIEFKSSAHGLRRRVEENTLDDPGKCPTCKPMECDGRGNCSAQSWTPTSPEHVMEIRTKRGIPSAKCVQQLKDVVPIWTPAVAEAALKKCTPVTREVWIDGVKWGVLKEGQ